LTGLKNIEEKDLMFFFEIYKKEAKGSLISVISLKLIDDKGGPH
jgi:hypothetical protein